jgi:hypothetical protein
MYYKFEKIDNSEELSQKIEDRRKKRKDKINNKPKEKIIGLDKYEHVVNFDKSRLGGYVKYYDKDEYERGDDIKFKGYGILLKVDDTTILLTNGKGKLWRVMIDNHIFFYKANVSEKNRLRYKLLSLIDI